jgi:hypothetical protein
LETGCCGHVCLALSAALESPLRLQEKGTSRPPDERNGAPTVIVNNEATDPGALRSVSGYGEVIASRTFRPSRSSSRERAQPAKYQPQTARPRAEGEKSRGSKRASQKSTTVRSGAEHNTRESDGA